MKSRNLDGESGQLMATLMLDKLRTATTVQEKTDLILRDTLTQMSISERKWLLHLALYHWFDLDMALAVLRKPSHQDLKEYLDNISFLHIENEEIYSFNDSIRRSLLSIFWNEDNKAYIKASEQNSQILEKMIENITNDLQNPDNFSTQLLRRRNDLQEEWLYHLLVADEQKGIEHLNNFIFEMQATQQFVSITNLLNLIEENVILSRVSPQVILWFKFWSESFDVSNDLQHKISFFKTLLSEARMVGGASGLDALLFRQLSDITFEHDNIQEAWTYFLEERQEIKKYNKIITYLTDMFSPINFIDPNPNDCLWLGLNLIDRTYKDFVGRKNELADLKNWGTEPESSVISVLGMGGIGKTTLVHHFARMALQESIFENVCWVSAKQNTFVANKIDFMPDRSDFSNLLDVLVANVSKSSRHQEYNSHLSKLKEISAHFEERRVLLVIDNVDSMSDFENLTIFLPNILGRSKVIITSRVNNIWSNELANRRVMHLNELTEQASMELIRSYTNNLSYPSTRNFERTIYSIVGGHPLLLRYGLSRLNNTTDIEAVLDQLNDAQSDIYQFIFADTWKALSVYSRLILRFLARSHTSIGLEELVRSTKLQSSIIDNCLRELVDKELIKKPKDKFTRDTKLGLSKATTNFVLSMEGE